MKSCKNFLKSSREKERERGRLREGVWGGRGEGRLAAKQVHTLPRIDPVRTGSREGQGRKCVSLLRVKAQNLPVPRCLLSFLLPLSSILCSCVQQVNDRIIVLCTCLPAPAVSLCVWLCACVCVFQFVLACEQLALKSLNVCILMPLSSRLMRDLVDYADACVISVPHLVSSLLSQQQVPHPALTQFSGISDSTNFSFTILFFCALFLLLFSSSLCPLLYARVWNFIFLFFFLLACCLLHGNCLCWGICGNKCNPYDPYDPTACIVVLRAQRVREGWIEAGKEIDGEREKEKRTPAGESVWILHWMRIASCFYCNFWPFYG